MRKWNFIKDEDEEVTQDQQMVNQPLNPERKRHCFTTIHTTVVYPYDTASKKHRPQLSKPENQQRKLTIR